MKFLAQLQNPPREFTAIPFWFLNGELTAEELRRQLADFAAHGIYGVVLHPRMGLSPDITYLGERYFAHIRTAVEAAAALDMKIVLYDEGMYPSGSASGLVVKDHPELASEGITLTQTVLPGDELLAQAESGALVVRKSGGTMRGLHWGEDDGEKNAPKTADILNPAAVSRFIELTHEAYYRELKEHFGAAIIGFFTDEPSILGRNVSGMFPWTHGFAEIFRRAGGNTANLTALFDGMENDDTRLYHKLLLQREGEVYYGTLSRWCKAHGIGLMGHPHQSDDIEVEKYFAVPGQDLVLRWLAPEKDGLAGIDSTMAKCSADAARLMHRRRNANECFGACNKDDNPWQLSGGDIKWYTDWLAVRGVNLFIPHAFYYSICGKRKDERPPDVGPHSIWWAHYEAWSTYWQRLSWLMTDIDLHAEAAVLCRNRDLCPDTVRPLFERQIGFQYIPESYFPACTVEDGALWLHGHRYTAVLGDKALFPDAAHPVQLVPAELVGHVIDALLHLGHVGQPHRVPRLVVEQGGDGLQGHVPHAGHGVLGRLGEVDVLVHQQSGVAGQVVGVVADALDVARDGKEAADHGGALLIGLEGDELGDIAGNFPVQKVDILLTLLDLLQTGRVPIQNGPETLGHVVPGHGQHPVQLVPQLVDDDGGHAQAALLAIGGDGLEVV